MRHAVDYSLYLVTGRTPEDNLVDVVRRAVQGGVSVVQIREKEMDAREFVALAQAVKAALAPHGVPLIINDRVDVALAVDAEGVHVGQDDTPAASVRDMIGPDKLLGLSVHTPDDIRRAEALPVDYLGVGPVFPTTTKLDAKPPLGLEGFAALRALTDLPLAAIGGVDIDNTSDVIRAGADGVAVVSAICSAGSPEQASRDLLAAVRTGRS